MATARVNQLLGYMVYFCNFFKKIIPRDKFFFKQFHFSFQNSSIWTPMKSITSFLFSCTKYFDWLYSHEEGEITIQNNNSKSTLSKLIYFNDQELKEFQICSSKYGEFKYAQFVFHQQGPEKGRPTVLHAFFLKVTSVLLFLLQSLKINWGKSCVHCTLNQFK